MTGQGPHLDEERSAAPGISPGVVGNEEYLLRELYFPEHSDDEAGSRLNVRAIPVKDLLERGFSVHRRLYVDTGVIKERIEERLKRARPEVARISLGVAKLKTEAVRRLRIDADTRAQALVVIDTATTELPWHASIFAVHGTTKSVARKLRESLLLLLRDHMMTVEMVSGERSGDAEPRDEGAGERGPRAARAGPRTRSGG